MKNEFLKTSLENLGFKQGARDKNNYYEDIGTPVTGLVYLTRKHENQHQYVSLCSYENEFVEAVVDVYQNVYNSRAKVQQTPLHATLYRTLEDVVAAVNKVYELPKKS
jgi:hypothetical protein